MTEEEAKEKSLFGLIIEMIDARIRAGNTDDDRSAARREKIIGEELQRRLDAIEARAKKEKTMQ